jgi:hypothetical protein
MKRHLLAAVLVLWTQVFAVLAPATLVHCVHEDGQSAVELCGSECCRAAHEAERRVPHDDAPALRLADESERCRDVPVQPQQTSISRAAPRLDAPRSVPAAHVAIVVDATSTRLLAARPPRLSSRAPPPDAVPRRARPFVLRC